MRTAVPQRQDMMHFRRLGQPSFLPALFAQRMRCQEPCTYPFPLTAGVHLPCRLVAAIPIVLPVRKFLVFLAVPFFRQPGAAGETARSFGLPWQRHHLRMLFTTWHVIRCCTELRHVVFNIQCCLMFRQILVRYFQHIIFPNVMPVSGHVKYNVPCCPMSRQISARCFQRATLSDVVL